MMRYEDVIQWPAVVLADVFRYLEVDASDPTSSACCRRPSSRARASSIKPAPRPRVRGRWRTGLPPDLQRVADQALGDLAVEFGYQR